MKRNKIMQDNEIVIEKGMKVELPPQFVKFWNLREGDHVIVYKGKETVMLLPPITTNRKRQKRGNVSLQEQLLAMINNAEKPIELEQLMIPDRARSTIRGRLSELRKQGKVAKTFNKKTGLIYYKKVEEKKWNESMEVKEIENKIADLEAKLEVKVSE